MLPPYFNKSEQEVFGTPGNNDFEHPIADKDSGSAALTNIELQSFAFKVPTVRNIALTAPYMHNGIYNSLEEVTAFYNHGGGIGSGLTFNRSINNRKIGGNY